MSDAASLGTDGLPLALPRAFAALPRRGDRVPIGTGIGWLKPKLVVLGAPWRRRRAAVAAQRALHMAAGLEQLSDLAFDTRRRAVSATLRRDGLSGQALVGGIAVSAEACRRALDLRPFRSQMVAAASLAGGEVVEMDTGEGKTVAALLAAAVCALGGRSVHLITANDYLAERDHAFLRPALLRLGLESAVIVERTTTAERWAAYRTTITFVSGKEVAFDYLRDGLVRGGDTRDRNLSAKVSKVLGEASGGSILQTALDVAIIDEVDSVLIDEAGTPLIISATGDDRTGAPTIATALRIAATLEPGRHYRFAPGSIIPDLSPQGLATVEQMISSGSGPWQQRLRREELVRAAVGALRGLHRDRDYLVTDGKVVIIDPHSGRTMADRQWGHDLHAMVEAKEGLTPSAGRKALASISFQRFFRNYQHVAGMSGTVREVAGELATVYGLRLTRVPRRLPRRRGWGGRQIFANGGRRWVAAIDELARRHALGQPVMVAVRSVEQSRAAAAELDRRGIQYRLLSAAQDSEEADTVAQAGQRGAVTVVTNMAGRGTDIKLGSDVAALGGLAVLVCERHESRRVDRQLMGRAARQGDPGEVVEFLSCEDAIVAGAPGFWRQALRSSFGRRVIGGVAFRRIQRAKERLDETRRFDLVRRDEQLARMLAFAGGLD